MAMKPPAPKMGEAFRKLKPRHQLFVTSYLDNGWHATNAAIACGSTISNAHVYGSRMLANPKIRAAIDEGLKAGQLSADQVLKRLAEMATVNLADFVDKDGKINDEVFRKKGYLVKKHKSKTVVVRGKEGDLPEEHTDREIELHDAQNALIHIGRYHKLFKDQVDHTSSDGALAGMVILVNKDELPQPK